MPGRVLYFRILKADTRRASKRSLVWGNRLDAWAKEGIDRCLGIEGPEGLGRVFGERPGGQAGGLASGYMDHRAGTKGHADAQGIRRA